VIDVALESERPRIVVVTFSGNVPLAEAEQDRRFGDLVKSFNAAPFRVLCDFRLATVLEAGVAEAFLRAQSFSIKANMERDAFVTSSPELRSQFERIAQDTRRFHWLGPLQFFHTIESARAYLSG
jgi:hypothetical protein